MDSVTIKVKQPSSKSISITTILAGIINLPCGFFQQVGNQGEAKWEHGGVGADFVLHPLIDALLEFNLAKYID